MRNITIAAAGVAILLVIAFMWWFQTDLILGAAYAFASLIAVATVPLSYQFFGFLKRDQAKALAEREQKHYDKIMINIQTISNNLNEVGQLEASKQTDRLLGMVDDYHEVIRHRFADSPLSTSGHFKIAQQVQNIVVENLSDVVVIAKSISGIDRSDLAASTEEEDGKDKAITRRLELIDEQRSKMDKIIEGNRTLLTALAETLVEVANIQKHGETDHSEAVQRLRELADRAKKFQI